MHKSCKVLAEFYNVAQEEILLGAGLDGLIFDIMNLILQSNDELILPAVTFRNAIYAANNKGAVIKQIPMKPDFAVDFELLIKAISDKTKIVFLCNPNNPTGVYEPLSSIRKLLESTNALVVLDEANVEFSGGSAVSLIKEFNNLLVLRTFSKAYGHAGMRVGYGISKSSLLKKISSIRPPFFLSTLSEIASCEAILDQTHLQNSVNYIIKERDYLEKELTALGFVVIPSQSNTLLCRAPNYIESASNFIRHLNNYDCHVVNGTYFNLDDRYLRIAPRLHEVNEKFIGILKSIL